MKDSYAEKIWNYMKMQQSLRKCDAVFILASIDDRVAEYGAKLFLQGYGDWLIVSGGVAHADDLLSTDLGGKSEAEHFADIAIGLGVNAEKIIIENEATNTGENIKLTYEILRQRNISLSSVVLVQKPYMERRTYATFEKQWPGESVDFIVTSPQILYEDYFNELQPKDKIINIMVGDLQRIKEYPALGFQTEQAIPDDVWRAFEELVKMGYDKHLIKG